jgi:hypothetical protein
LLDKGLPVQPNYWMARAAAGLIAAAEVSDALPP